MKDFRDFIDEIIETPKFKELNSFIRITETAGYNIYNIFLNYFRATGIDYETFYEFMNAYFNNTPHEIIYNEEGYVDMSKLLCLKQLRIFANSSGNFLDCWLIMTDGTKYMSKKPLNHLGNSGIQDPNCKYPAVIASNMAKQLGIETAEYILADSIRGHRILTRNFLKEREELITYNTMGLGREDLISTTLKSIQNELKIRRFPEEEIEKCKFEFLKQEFLAKLIGLKDQKADNSPIIISIDEQGKKHVKMAPMMDYDYSFYIAEDDIMCERKCDNGKADIVSFIEQYIDYPGFKEFLDNSIKKFNMEEVFNQIYEKTGMNEFKQYKDEEEMLKFIEFSNNNMEKVKNYLKQLSNKERGEK